MRRTITACGKPRRCPACGSKNVENILYSNPPVSKPKWHCTGCGVKIYLRTSRRCKVSHEAAVS